MSGTLCPLQFTVQSLQLHNETGDTDMDTDEDDMSQQHVYNPQKCMNGVHLSEQRKQLLSESDEDDEDVEQGLTAKQIEDLADLTMQSRHTLYIWTRLLVFLFLTTLVFFIPFPQLLDNFPLLHRGSTNEQHTAQQIQTQSTTINNHELLYVHSVFHHIPHIAPPSPHPVASPISPASPPTASQLVPPPTQAASDGHPAIDKQQATTTAASSLSPITSTPVPPASPPAPSVAPSLSLAIPSSHPLTTSPQQPVTKPPQPPLVAAASTTTPKPTAPAFHFNPSATNLLEQVGLGTLVSQCSSTAPFDVNLIDYDFLGMPFFPPISTQNNEGYVSSINDVKDSTPLELLSGVAACCYRCRTSLNCIAYIYYPALNMCVMKGPSLTFAKPYQPKFNDITTNRGVKFLNVNGQESESREGAIIPTTQSLRIDVGFISRDLTAGLPFHSYPIPSVMVIGPHPRHGDPAFPACKPLPARITPDHGHLGFCGSNEMPVGGICDIPCDPGYVFEGNIPMCGLYVVHVVQTTLSVNKIARNSKFKCVKQTDSPFDASYQYYVEKRVNDFPVASPILPALMPSCPAGTPLGHCLTAQSFQISTASTSLNSILLTQYIQSLPLFASKDGGDCARIMSLTPPAPTVTLEQHLDPTGQYSIWPPAIIIASLLHRTDRLAGALDMLYSIQYPFDRVFYYPSIRHKVPYWGCLFTHWQAGEWAIQQKFQWYFFLEDDIRLMISPTQFINHLNQLGRQLMTTMRNEAKGIYDESDTRIHVFKFEGLETQWKAGPNYPNARNISIDSGLLVGVTHSVQAGAYIVNATFAPRLQSLRASTIEKFRYRLNTNDGENTKFRNDRLWAQLMVQNDTFFYQPYPDIWMSQTSGFSDMEDKVMHRAHGQYTRMGRVVLPPTNQMPRPPRQSDNIYQRAPQTTQTTHQ